MAKKKAIKKPTPKSATNRKPELQAILLCSQATRGMGDGGGVNLLNIFDKVFTHGFPVLIERYTLFARLCNFTNPVNVEVGIEKPGERIHKSDIVKVSPGESSNADLAVQVGPIDVKQEGIVVFSVFADGKRLSPSLKLHVSKVPSKHSS